MRFVDKTALEYTQLKDAMRRMEWCEPIIVRTRMDGKFEIVHGLKRYTIAKDLGWNIIPAEIREVNDDDAIRLAIMANAVKTDPKPVEYAHQIRQLLARNPDDCTAGYVAGMLCQPVDWVKKQLGLLLLDPKVQRDVDAGRIKLQNAYTLSLCPKTWQLEWREKAMILTAEELRAEVIPLLKQWRQKIIAGKPKREFNFEPVANLRSMKILKAGLDNPGVADRMVKEVKCDTQADAFRLGVAWALCLDPAAAQAQRLAALRKHEKLEQAETRRRKERNIKAGSPKPLFPNPESEKENNT